MNLPGQFPFRPSNHNHNHHPQHHPHNNNQNNNNENNNDGTGVNFPLTGDIPSIATQVPDLSTLVFALTKAGLVSSLDEEGPFTVFAPDNRAFSTVGSSLSLERGWYL